MKLAINLVISLGMLVLFLWLMWPSHDAIRNLKDVLHDLDLATFVPYVLGFYLLLAFIHLCRSWRWHYLLAPLGVRVSFSRLLAVSSVGFMAILVLPARLGEFVRPALIRRRGELSASQALGTVAVERIIDGLVVSILVFVCFFALRGPHAPGWMMPTAYAALGVFAAALVFLLCSMRWPEQTVRFSLKLTLLPRFAPRIAAVIEHKLLDMIRGLAVLRDRKNLAAFGAWSAAYWIANGFATWLLARGFGLPLSMVGAFATMGLVAVGITLPNSPGLVGQFQWFTMLGVSLYLGPAAADSKYAAAHGLDKLYATVLAYAIFIHLLQVVWYVGMGVLGMASQHVSFAELRASRKLDPEPAAGEPGGA
ncbi:MAG TPA: lysylphosphatidylglycerol synthase transmembrane domain-containing protein [Kofleriaceae bacterium]|nr:lysylphosphatidylglycerol synthase transmembrane domain-containing protein [Kofleriaceae bacterium]